ncbi:MAG: ATP-binding protein [Bacteroidetes bacterium]|nr:ATP-binding protein [Bacteroidota bacterium]
MSETPFIFGKLAEGLEFTDREAETAHLVQNFNSLTNTILISPRRWGKSSLVLKASELARKKNKNIRFCFIDLYNVKSDEEFYNLLAMEVLKASSTKIEEIASLAAKFLKQIIPRISINPEAGSDISLGFEWRQLKKHPIEIINLAEEIAREKNLKFIICIDEFQNIGFFEDPLQLQKKLRANWQRHKHVSYCLFGSKRHMMMDVFASPSMPFYKFGDLIFLEKISSENWVSFILRRFTENKKTITEETAALIAEKCENHPFYVQQLAQLSWLRTSKKCTSAIVEQALDSLLHQLSLLFQTITENLSPTQINLMKAIVNEEQQLSAQETLYQYQLGTSANVAKSRNALINKEIIDVIGKEVFILDPIYKLWLKTYYFKGK